MKNWDYEQTVKLKHNERAVILDESTGEIKDVKLKVNNIPEGKELFGKEEIAWRKSFDYSWDFLEENLTDLELRVVMKMCRLAEMNTNSLKPLNDLTTQIIIAETFNIDFRKSKKLFAKLYKLGVYGRFDVYDESNPYTKYWILNPYLSFGGKLIKSEITNLFKGTTLTKEYFRRLAESKSN